MLRVTLPRTHAISNGKIMDQNLERETVIELLGRLGDDDDDSVLAAARSLHATIRDANVDWNDLLVPDADMDTEDYDDEEEDDYDDDDDDDDDDEDERAQTPIADGDESLALIERLLGGPDVSNSLREELQGYKEDISENEFTASDAAYLKLLAERLKG